MVSFNTKYLLLNKRHLTTHKKKKNAANKELPHIQMGYGK